MKPGIILLLAFFAASPIVAQWKKTTPRQTLPVPADGSTVDFTQVSLPAGMTYHVHADGTLVYQSGQKISDACYFLDPIFSAPISPLLGGQLGVKIKYNNKANEDWYFTLAGTPIYNPNHTYDISSLTSSSFLSMHFFDKADAPNNYYSDNSGAINIEVAQQTPSLNVQYDTIYFNNIIVNNTSTKFDTIQALGLLSYDFEGASLITTAPANVFTATSEHPATYTIPTDQTNGFVFTYTPWRIGSDTAFFHIHSNTAWTPDRDRVIVLIGTGIGAEITIDPDTLDFGTVALSNTKQLTTTFHNKGLVGATISSVTISPAGQPFSCAPTSFAVNPLDSAKVTVTFSPTVGGTYFADFICSAIDGSKYHFYAKGISGQGIAKFSSKLLDFGLVVLNQSRQLLDTVRNIGTANLNVVSTLNSNPTEYSVVGSQGPYIYTPNSGQVYNFIFHPINHLPGWQNHDGYFALFYDDGRSDTIFFKGADHKPVEALLKIDDYYTVVAGRTVDVSQRSLAPLDSSLTPVRSLSERITYDNSKFELISVSKGALISSSAWSLNSTKSTGAVDISIFSSTDHLGPTGQLLKLTFKALSTDVPGDQTLLPQYNIDFSNPIEPILTSATTGKIIVTDLCSPVHLSSSPGPVATSIDQNYPNPVQTQTQVWYSIGASADGSLLPVRIELFDAMGKVVKTLVDENKEPGYYGLSIEVGSLPAGMYWYALTANGIIERRAMIVTK